MKSCSLKVQNIELENLIRYQISNRLKYLQAWSFGSEFQKKKIILAGWKYQESQEISMLVVFKIL